MALDYRTPRPRVPIDTEKPFARFGTWSVQHLRRGRWLAIARRVHQAPAIEWALGYCSGCWRGKSPKANAEEIWVVGPDGFGYFCLEAPSPEPEAGLCEEGDALQERVLDAGLDGGQATSEAIEALGAHEKTCPRCAVARLALLFFEGNNKPLLEGSGMPPEGIESLRRSYVAGVLANPTAQEELRKLYGKPLTE